MLSAPNERGRYEFERAFCDWRCRDWPSDATRGRGRTGADGFGSEPSGYRGHGACGFERRQRQSARGSRVARSGHARDRAAGGRVPRRQARHRRVGRYGRSSSRQTRRWRHIVHALLDDEGRHRDVPTPLRREARAELRHADRERVARIRRARQREGDVAHGSSASDRRPADTRRLHAGMAARLGPHVPRHRGPRADVSYRRAHRLPLVELRLHQR